MTRLMNAKQSSRSDPKWTTALCCVLATLTVSIATARGAWSQTFVQLTDLDPTNQLGPRLTRTVVTGKLSGNPLFAEITSKITLIDAVASPWVAYEFASDLMWNRVLFGQKDQYIYGFTNSGDSTNAVLRAPGGIAVSGSRIVYIADQQNARIVLAQFDAGAKTLTRVAVTPSDPDLRGVINVGWDDESAPLTANYFYALDATGRISWWQWTSGAPVKLWSYGAWGTSSGQFRGPRGICVGRSAGADGGSRSTADIYVADAGNHRLVWLHRISGTALWEATVTLPNGGIPAACTVDHFGNVTVADELNSRLLKYTWNLTYLDQYGTYGTGATNDNTFAHPHAVHAPFGTIKNAVGATVWYGEGRVITAEDWGDQSGAREHYLGINSTITAQPNHISSTGHWDFTYSVTDHANHQGVTVLDANGNIVRSGLSPTGLQPPPGPFTADWDGTNNNSYVVLNGSYKFQVRVISAYGCSGLSWCDQTLTTSTFSWTGGPPLLSATLTGPTDITQAGTYTWTANPTGGTGTYTYAWQYRDAFNQNWVGAGSGRSVSKSVSASTASWFDYQVVVSSGIQSKQLSVHVINELGTCNPRC